MLSYREFVSGISRAFEHKGGIKTLSLGTIQADWFSQIQRECAWIIKNAGSSDVGDKKHITNWTRPTGEVHQFSLFNTSGDSADTKGDFGYLGDAKKKRLTFPQLDGLARFARLFIPELRNLRLNGMGTSAALNAHEENSITPTPVGATHIVRFHLPIFSNPDARIYLDDECFRYREGTLYFFNHGCVHAAANNGAKPRYHLVFDAFLNRALFSRIFPGSPSPDPGYVKVDEMAVAGEYYHFPNFKREDGLIIDGAIDYGRHVPKLIDFYKRRYPSLFGHRPTY